MASAPRASKGTRQRRARGSITPEEVIRGALELSASDTVDGLSMPRLAEHLGLGVTSIYWYFKSKEDLMDALTEEAFKRFYAQMPPVAGHRWHDALREFFRNFRNIMRNDDVMCDLCIMRGSTYSDATLALIWARIEEILEILVAQGFSQESATEAYFALSVYTRGCLFIERLSRSGDVGASQEQRARLARNMPVMSEGLQKHSWHMVDDDDFEFGLENAIRGLRALRNTEKRKMKSQPSPS